MRVPWDENSQKSPGVRGDKKSSLKTSLKTGAAGAKEGIEATGREGMRIAWDLFRNWDGMEGQRKLEFSVQPTMPVKKQPWRKG